MTEPTTEARRWAVFEDEDHTFCIVTEDGGDMVTWPEMTEADCDRVVAEHNALAEARASLDVDVLARALNKAHKMVGQRSFAQPWTAADAEYVRLAILAETER